MRAKLFVVSEELRFLEFPDQPLELGGGKRLLERVRTRREVALRRLYGRHQRLRAQVEDQVVALLTGGNRAREIDRTRLARGDALPV